MALVPQYTEYGFDSGLWMLETERGIAPNLILGWVKGEHRLLAMEQIEDFYEDYYWNEDLDQSVLEEHVTDLGTLDCSQMDDDEWEEELASILWDNDDVWWNV